MQHETLLYKCGMSKACEVIYGVKAGEDKLLKELNITMSDAELWP